ncbi:MAG: FGGY-family carbohydrate kinase [Anaerolineae bacterium]|nr:FGGY-family carbohydrate kinase [Anaerolineae bacterium]
MPAPPLLIGVDVGTSETKAGLFDAQGSLLRLSARHYPVLIGAEPGTAEQDAEIWWQAVCEALREIARECPPGHLAALCVQGQGPSPVLIDQDGLPLRHVILWMDARAARMREELSVRLGKPVSPFTHVAPAMGLLREVGAAAVRARWLLTAWDFIAFRLCGRAATSVMAAFDPFPPALVAAAELPTALIAPQVEAGRVLGGLTPQAAESTGLPAGLPVVAGVHDGIATFMGAGLTRPGMAADVDGASGGLALCWDRPIEEQGIFCEAWITPGQYIVGGAMAALGLSVDWYREHIALPGSSVDELLAAAMTVPPGADGLLFLPYLAGERAPIWDQQAKGVFFGLTLRHTRNHLARAVFESVAFAVRHLVERLALVGAQVQELRVCGGQAKSMDWNQLKANIIGFPVAVPRVTEAALLGAAILAAVGAGVLPDVVAGAERMVRIGEVLEPHPEQHRRYEELYAVYRRLYPDLKEAFHQLHRVTVR